MNAITNLLLGLWREAELHGLLNRGSQKGGDSGLMLLGHRYYDASTGRFLTRDPIKDGRNWSSYAANRPTLATDPDGLQLALLIAAIEHELALPPPFPPGESIEANIARVQANLQFELEAAAAGGGSGGGFAIGDWTAHVEPGGSWDYKKYADDPEIYDDAGNFNYGGTGAALGFPLKVLLAVGEADSQAMYGIPDDQDDIYWTIRGYAYYQRYHD